MALSKYKLKQYQRIVSDKLSLIFKCFNYDSEGVKHALDMSWDDISDVYWMKETDFMKLAQISAKIDYIKEEKQ